MEKTKARFKSLLDKYIVKACTEEEFRELFAYLDLPEYRKDLEDLMDLNYRELVPSADAEVVDWDEMYTSIVDTPGKHRTRSIWTVLLPIAAAVVILLSVGLFVLDNYQKTDQKVMLAKLERKDIEPGGNRAILTLANGSKIVLDGHHSGVLASEGGARISKTTDGKVRYDVSNIGDADVTDADQNHINTLSTPRGGQYMVILPDRSKVWLNAESSISFPSVFSGTERLVSLSGEAYFEVYKDKEHPFKVKAGAAEVSVLGTHFNIMTYPEEPESEISLAEGSVRVDLGKNSRMLVPGQQARYKRNSAQMVLKSVDMEEVLDWKNGFFMFDNTPVDQVMRQIQRWYNVEVVYEGSKPVVSITGIISRSNKISKILALIEETGGVDFEIGEKQITVKAKKGR
jgi:transmembrane sensor